MALTTISRDIGIAAALRTTAKSGDSRLQVRLEPLSDVMPGRVSST
jgi:hypothetical protein